MGSLWLPDSTQSCSKEIKRYQLTMQHLTFQDRSKEDTWKESDLKKALKVRNLYDINFNMKLQHNTL